MNVTADEFAHINEVYMNSDLDKDEFCKVWAKMNKSRVQRHKEEERKQDFRDSLLRILANMIWIAPEERYKIAVRHLTDREVKTLKTAGISMETPNGDVNRFKYCIEIARDLKAYLNIK